MFVMNLLNKTGLAEDREMISAGPAGGSLMVWRLADDGISHWDVIDGCVIGRREMRGRWSTNDINYSFVLIPM